MQDEAGRELLALLSELDMQIGAALVSYLGLFRSARRDLANDRALCLAMQTLSLINQADDPDQGAERLTVAMQETVQALRDKQTRRPLKNHHYLMRVLENIPQSAGRPGRASTDVRRPQIERNRNGDAGHSICGIWGGWIMKIHIHVPVWLGEIVKTHIVRLRLLSLESAPLAASMGEVTRIWAEIIAVRRPDWDRDLDTRRLHEAFLRLEATCDRWPTPNQLMQHLPPRPQVQALPRSDISPSQRKRNKARIKALITQLFTDKKLLTEAGPAQINAYDER